jgi:hypothetical protein
LPLSNIPFGKKSLPIIKFESLVKILGSQENPLELFPKHLLY